MANLSDLSRIRIGLLFQRAALRGALQYRFNLALMVVTGMLYQGSGFAFVWVVLNRFPTLAGWTFAEVAFLYGLRLVAHAAFMVPMNMLIGIDFVIRDGEFDRYLLRPLNPLVQLMTTRAMRMGSTGDLLTGLAILIVASQATQVNWTPVAICFVVLAVLGGALIEAAVQLALGALAFRLLSTFDLRVFVDGIFGRFGSYPLKIFGSGAEWFLTFVLPVAFIAYVPASVLLGDATASGLRVAPWVGYLTPVIGLALFWLGYLF